VRVGLVGTGYWAGEVHAAGVAAVEGVELSAVWGRDLAKAEQLAARYGATAYADAAEMFHAVDAVTFAVPPHVQAPLAVQAAAAGCHLLLEKPVALTVEDAEAVVAAVERAGVSSVVFVTSRHQEPVEQWLQEVHARGGWSGAVAVWVGSIFHEGNPFSQSQWRKDEGALWDIGPHALSMLVPTLGPVTGVTAAAGPGDTVHLVLRHSGGASSTATVSLTVPEAAGALRFDLYGEQGWASVPTDHGIDPVQAHSAAVRSLVLAADGGPAHPADARFGADAVHVLAEAQAQLDRARAASQAQR
jgi:predicted dehydrogenase